MGEVERSLSGLFKATVRGRKQAVRLSKDEERVPELPLRGEAKGGGGGGNGRR